MRLVCQSSALPNGERSETRAECLRFLKLAEIRLANEIDSAQARGEIKKRGKPNGNLRSSEVLPATYDELGISYQRVAEWRMLRDAGEEIVDAVIQAALDEGRAAGRTKGATRKGVGSLA